MDPFSLWPYFWDYISLPLWVFLSPIWDFLCHWFDKLLSSSFACSVCQVDMCFSLWPWWFGCDWSDLSQRSLCTDQTSGSSWTHQHPGTSHSLTGTASAQAWCQCLSFYTSGTNLKSWVKFPEKTKRLKENRKLSLFFWTPSDFLDGC